MNSPHASCVLAFVAMLFWLGAAAAPASAQQTGTISGDVVEAATQRPLAGAQVTVPGTGIGTLTNDAGTFLLLNVPAGEAVVQVQMIGYGTEERTVTVTDGSTVRADFELRGRAIALEEVVVTGTAGAARRREIGNSIASVDVTELQEIKPVQDVSQLLQGQVAGLQQFTTGGQAGAGTQIRLRGNNSITQGNSPLIYVDGVRLASALPSDQGAQQVTSALDLLNPEDIARIEVIRGAAATTLYGTEANSGVIQIFTKRGAQGAPVWSLDLTGGARFLTSNGLGPVVGNDETWVSIKPWARTGPTRELSGSVRGSSQGVSYYLSGEYSYEGGVLPTQDTKRVGFRTNLGFEPLSDLSIDVSTSYAHRLTNWVQSGDNIYGAILNLLRSPRNYTGGDDAQIFEQRTTSIDDHFVGGMTATYTPVASITNRLTVGLDWRDATNDWTIPAGNVLLEAGARDVSRWRHTTLTLDYVGTWSHDFAPSVNSRLSWGFQVFNDYDHEQFGSTEAFSGPGVEQTLSSGAINNSSEELLRVTNAGFFLQEMVGLGDQLFVTGGIRVDGNSAFGQDFGLQPYPKLSASYIISDNDFWPVWWQVMKLRAAVGESGRAPGVFDATRTYEPISGNGGRPGITPENLGDPNLGPERTREIELGFEGGAFDGRVGLDFTWYQATTRDALVPIQFPPSEGFAEPQLTNVGKIRNRGIEARLTVTPIRTRNLTWDASLQFSTNESEALDLQGAKLQIGFQSWRQWAREGYPVPSYFGVRVQNPEEVAEPVYSDTVEYYGGVYPTRNWGISSTVDFLEDFTFYIQGEAAAGHFLMNAVARQNAVRELWPECGPVLANLEQQTAIWRARCDDKEWAAWIVPADYFKLRTVSLTYSLPDGLIPGTRTASLSIAGINLWKSTEYGGLDPEITRGDRFLEKREYYGLPPTQSVSASLQITF